MVGIPGARKFPETFCFQIIVSMKMAWYFSCFANTRPKKETGKKSKKKTIGKRIQNQKKKIPTTKHLKPKIQPKSHSTTTTTQKKRKKKRDTHTQQKHPSSISISISISISTRNSPTSRPSRLHKNMSSIRHPIIILPISISRSPPRSKRQSNRLKSIRIDFFQLHELCKGETFVAVVRGRHYFFLFIYYQVILYLYLYLSCNWGLLLFWFLDLFTEYKEVVGGRR